MTHEIMHSIFSKAKSLPYLEKFNSYLNKSSKIGFLSAFNQGSRSLLALRDPAVSAIKKNEFYKLFKKEFNTDEKLIDFVSDSFFGHLATSMFLQKREMLSALSGMGRAEEMTAFMNKFGRSRDLFISEPTSFKHFYKIAEDIKSNKPSKLK